MNIKNKSALLVKRIIFSLLGMVAIIFGIALYIRAALGLTCGDVIPVAASYFTPLSIGQCAMIFQVLCIVVQVLILRKLSLSHLVQLPLALLYGVLLDFFLYLLSFEPSALAPRIALLVAGLLILSFGVRLVVGASLMLMPLDGLAREIGNLLGGSMAKGKLTLDISVTLIAVALTSILARSPFLVVSIGTVVCALATGPLIGLHTRLFPGLTLVSKAK